MSLHKLALRIDGGIRLHFTPSDDIYDGQDYASLVAEQAGIHPDSAEQMRDRLSRSRGFEMRKDGEDDIYDASVTYVEARVSRWHYRKGWDQFKNTVKHSARYFNREAENFLADIFTDLEKHRSVDGGEVVSLWLPGPDRQLVRGRVAHNDEELSAFLANPASEIGPPPQGKASAGRMNAEGVSAFYGALDIPTCRAEVRPPVGSHVVFAKFEILRPLRILDVGALERIYVPGSIFDPEYGNRLERTTFMRNFGAEIAQPVMPRDKLFGYLPTQIVADYIGQRLNLDGMVISCRIVLCTVGLDGQRQNSAEANLRYGD